MSEISFHTFLLSFSFYSKLSADIDVKKKTIGQLVSMKCELQDVQFQLSDPTKGDKAWLFNSTCHGLTIS
jgi:hypothetical protein